MKKFLKIRYLLLFVFIFYSLSVLLYHIIAPAKILYDPFRVEYKNTVYIEGLSDYYQYELVKDESYDAEEKHIWVKDRLVVDFFFPFEYFEAYCESFDKQINFICLNSYDTVFVKEGFVFPTIEENEVSEVWMSASSTYEIIKDKEKVAKIVECAKSKGELELDEDVVEYIKKYSWDNHCFYLKYAGYPLVEEFHIEETEDGRYVVDQFTAEEYDTIYYHNTAHQ